VEIRCLHSDLEVNNMTDDENLFHDHLIAAGKLNYARGKRLDVDCIMCAVRDDNPDVISMKIYTEELLFICLNLYPYNPGHLMVIPIRHVEKFQELKENERNRLFEVVIMCQNMLQDLFHPTGFNVGYNQGKYSGASVNHVHVHIVPRYQSELGFIDIIGKTKIILESVYDVKDKILPKISQYIKQEKK